ncbi:MAG: bifunctional 4'-phosphopantothenoylcysteine decarboxylase/phosphopantothenoylcysteine synthetase, partial [Clostridiales bacterium]|nr:bifunctional 4'-phosphopantothenoylcysteine decarboxylase/phosphopantothenoylcysteine synthetase [Clostridiales bacterium]
IKTQKCTLSLVKNPDIAAKVGKVKGDKKLVIFAAETENTEENAEKKRISKSADLAVANDVTKEGAGFDCDTNVATLISEGKSEALPKMTKAELAERILDRVFELTQ